MPFEKNYNEFLEGFNSTKFSELWPAQKHVLEKYSSECVNVKDLAIELPTGAGKTLIALLVSEAWRQDGKKVAILSANKTLARQMESEGNALGIPVVLLEGRGRDIPPRIRRDYQRANKIAIMNYWVYFNQRPVIDPADLLIMDDAHLAEHCFHTLWSMEINKHDHSSLFTSLMTEISVRFPEYSVVQDALVESESNYNPPELFSFIDQLEISNRLREIIDASPHVEDNSDMSYRWQRVRSKLDEANIYLANNSIWIRPYIYPLQSNTHYHNSLQRIYLSATIGEASDLSRRLGTAKLTKMDIPSVHAQKTSGRRLIVMNRMEDKDIPDRLQHAILAVLEKNPKSVWMMSSFNEVERYRPHVIEWLNDHEFIGHESWTLTSLGNEIESFKGAQKGHLFVAGRFDGMDFKQDECRMVVLATLPRAINIQEEFICAYLRDASFMQTRLNQRIIQALGRCNRAPEDFAIYILADRRFATHFGRESNRFGIPQNIVAEIDMAEDMSEIEVTDLVGQIDKFLSSDFTDYDENFSSLLQAVPEYQSDTSEEELANFEILAWTALYESQNYTIAIDRFRRCWDYALENNLLEIGAFYGWCLAKALYLNAVKFNEGTIEDALQILEQAINRGGFVSWFNRMRIAINRIRNTTQLISQENESYSTILIRSFDKVLETNGNRFDRYCEKLTEDLNAENHNQFCDGLEKLGILLGFDADRPRHGSATDNRWRGVFGDLKIVITFEAKIEHEASGKIVASHIGQAHNQITRAKEEFLSLGYEVHGIIVTHLTELSDDAESSAGSLRCISKESIFELWEKVRRLLIQYRSQWSLDNIHQRKVAAESIRSQIPIGIWFRNAAIVDNRWISSELLFKDWPS